ncbi:hypothetical protein LB465_03030 [Salegentibacter sp. LM13S]|uniref:hypothetical protein n=1 Tax=Salegentibacter lacus TaxID=2873599 RepID=UPI001CCAA51F|nr:hypothetical protein [Salegentibacter lacus]MBZ9629740.1 hypothetical protein [Salegentibacter lacus]
MKKLLIIIFFSVPFLAFSQTIETRKGQLFFKIGTEYRITPLPYDAGESDPNIGLTNVGIQNSGLAINYSLDYFITKNLTLGFTNSFRYDLLLYNNEVSFDSPENNEGSTQVEKTLITDFHFYLNYHFQIFKNSEIFIRAGKSLANRGTDYGTKNSFFDQEGNLVSKSISQNNFHFQPENFGLGYKKDKVEVMAGVLTTTVTEYFLTNERFTIPYLKLSYNLGKL